MFIRPSGRLAELLAARADLLNGFEIDENDLAAHTRDVAANHPTLDRDERYALAVYTTLFHPNSKGNASELTEGAPHIDGAALHHVRAMNAQLRDSAQTRAAVLAATDAATRAIITALAGAEAEGAERVAAANTAAHATLAAGVQTFALGVQTLANRAADEAAELLTEAKRIRTATENAEDAERVSGSLLRGAVENVRDAIGVLTEQRRSEDDKRRIEHAQFATAEADRLAMLEANRDADARKRQQAEDAARIAAAELAERGAEERARRARIQRWIQIALLAALLAAMFAPRARAQVVAPITTASTGGSALTSFVSSAASTNATSVKASAGNVYTIRAVNTTATLYYLRMYNLASAPTCSSATGFVETIPIPASATGAGIAITQYPQGYTAGIGYCLTGGGGSTDNTNAATGVFVTVLYK